MLLFVNQLYAIGVKIFNWENLFLLLNILYVEWRTEYKNVNGTLRKYSLFAGQIAQIFDIRV